LVMERYPEAIAILSDVKPAPPELTVARMKQAKKDFADDPAKKEAYTKELRLALAAEPGSLRSLGWRADLIKQLPKDSPEIKTLTVEGRRLADELLADDARLKKALDPDEVGEFVGYERLLVATEYAEFADAAGLPKEDIEAAWTRAADIGRAY